MRKWLYRTASYHFCSSYFVPLIFSVEKAYTETIIMTLAFVEYNKKIDHLIRQHFPVIVINELTVAVFADGFCLQLKFILAIGEMERSI